MGRTVRKLLWMVAAQATIFLCVTNAQSRINGSCDLSVLGVTETKPFFQFDKELRYALSQGDASKMALLIEYPLRIGDDAGAYLIPDPTSFQGNFDRIFPPALRKQIVTEGPKSVWCSYRGISYSNGTLWVQPSQRGYRIETVNLPTVKRPAAVASQRVELVCRTEKLRAIVYVESHSHRSQLRLWNDTRSLDSKPDLVVEGVQIFEGTGPCAHAYYKFESGNQLIQIDDARGCHENENEPPEHAIGQIAFTDAKGQETSTWCY